MVDDRVAKNLVDDRVAKNLVNDRVAKNPMDDRVAKNPMDDWVAKNLVDDRVVKHSHNNRYSLKGDRMWDGFSLPFRSLRKKLLEGSHGLEVIAEICEGVFPHCFYALCPDKSIHLYPQLTLLSIQR